MIQVNEKPLTIRPALQLKEALREKGIPPVLNGNERTGYTILVIDSRIDDARRIFAALSPSPGVPTR